jgi:DnaB-like helicase N terminal domain
MTGLNGSGQHTGNGYQPPPGFNGHNPPPVTPLRVEPEPIAGWPAPPCDEELEQTLIGAVMKNNAAYPGFLRPEHFSLRVHQDIFEAIGALISRGEVANHVKHYFELTRRCSASTAVLISSLRRVFVFVGAFGVVSVLRRDRGL